MKNVSDITSLYASGSMDSKLTTKKSSMEFGNIMEQTLIKEQSTKVERKSFISSVKETKASNESTLDDKRLNTKKETIKDADINKSTVELKEEVTASKERSKIEKVSSLDEASKVNDVADDVIVEESLVATITNLVYNIEQMLMDKLGVSKEELEEHLEVLGLSMIDMLQVNNLKTLILAVNGTDDITNFLTNENLAKTLSELTDFMQNLQETVVDDLPLSKEQLYDMVQKVVGNEETSLQQELDSNSTGSAESENTPEFTVVKEGEVTNESNEASKQENSQFDTFMNQLTGANGTQTITQITGNFDQATIVREIVNQIVEKIKVIIKPEQTSMEMNLNPENLGKLHLSVVMKEGNLTAQFTTSSHAVKEVLESQMQVLKETLQVQGLKVEEIEVTVSNFEFTNSNQMTNGGNEHKDNSKKRKIMIDPMLHNDNASIEDTQEDRIETGTGSTLDYSV